MSSIAITLSMSSWYTGHETFINYLPTVGSMNVADDGLLSGKVKAILAVVDPGTSPGTKQ
jgi:hypothetical protein